MSSWAEPIYINIDVQNEMKIDVLTLGSRGSVSSWETSASRGSSFSLRAQSSRRTDHASLASLARGSGGPGKATGAWGSSLALHTELSLEASLAGQTLNKDIN